MDFAGISKDSVKTLVLLRDVAAAPFAKAHGLKVEQLNLGNVHFGTGRRQVSPSVFLAESELQSLQRHEAYQAGVRGRDEARGIPHPQGKSNPSRPVE